MASLKRLPKGFRYLLTLKEIKKIELDAGLRFESISNGNISNAKHFEPDDFFQSFFSGPSVDGYRKEDTWHFRVYQSGFRIELLPSELEDAVKQAVSAGILAFLHQVKTSTTTDFLQNPYKRAYVRVHDNEASVSWGEALRS